jgi:hypothetical protein
MTQHLSPDVALAGLAPAAQIGRLTVLVPCDVAHDAVGDFAGVIRRAAPLLRGQRLVVVAMWHSIEPAAGLARAAMPAGMVHVGVRNWNREQHERAHRFAQEAVAIAQECGLDATSEVRLVAGGWAANVAAVAGERGAEVVMLAHARRAQRLARLLRRAQKDAGGPAQLLLVAG